MIFVFVAAMAFLAVVTWVVGLKLAGNRRSDRGALGRALCALAGGLAGGAFGTLVLAFW